MIYIGTYLFLLLSSLIEIIGNKRSYIGASILLITLFFIAIFRSETGTDYTAYLSLWQNIDLFDPNKRDSYQYVEIGFRFFISMLKIFTENDFVYFSILAGAPLLFLSRALDNLNIYKSIALFYYYNFFYFAYLLNGIGQAITISLMLYSIKFINEKKIIPVIILCSGATLIHKSGLVILLLYILMNIKFSALSSFIGSLLMGLILLKLGLINLLLDFLFPGNFILYYEGFTESSSSFQIISKILIFTLFLSFALKIKNKLFQNIFRAYSFGIFMFISLMEHNVLATRILMLFKPLEILMILLIIKASKDTFTRISVFLIYLIPYSIQFYIIINHPDFYYNTKF